MSKNFLILKKSQYLLKLRVKIFKINKIHPKIMSKINNQDNQDYRDDRYDDREDYNRGPKPIKPVIEDDRHKTKPNYVSKE